MTATVRGTREEAEAKMRELLEGRSIGRPIRLVIASREALKSKIVERLTAMYRDTPAEYWPDLYGEADMLIDLIDRDRGANDLI